MPNSNRDQTVYIVTGNPDTMNVSPADWTSLGARPGELGKAFDKNDRAYQLVQLDSGATAATPVGVVAANQIAYWKDRVNYLVTNNRDAAEGGSATGAYRNNVAGLFRNAATAGYYISVLQRSDNVPVLDGGNTYATGEPVIAGANATASADRLAVGGNITFKIIGTARGAAAAGVVSIDLDIPNIP